jgi:hypothetical protein
MQIDSQEMLKVLWNVTQVSEKSWELARALLLFFSQILSSCRLYRHHVGTTGNTIGSTDLGSVYRYGFTGEF